jgi:hypothetical protein
MKKKPIVAWDRGQRLEFSSLTDAADYYNTNIASISCAIKRGTAWKHILFEYVDSITSPVPYKEREKDSLVVTIDGKTYYSEKAPNKIDCTDCDIFKAKPPRSMIEVPLCYTNSLNNHKIVDYCRAKRIIWKRER